MGVARLQMTDTHLLATSRNSGFKSGLRTNGSVPPSITRALAFPSSSPPVLLLLLSSHSQDGREDCPESALPLSVSIGFVTAVVKLLSVRLQNLPCVVLYQMYTNTLVLYIQYMYMYSKVVREQ